MVYNLLTCKEPFFKNHLCSTENVGLSARFGGLENPADNRTRQ